MSRVAYVNGRYLPLAQAGVSILDRAFVFGDGVYEVCLVRDGALIDEARHLARLNGSLKALRIAAPIGEAALRRVLREVVARNRVSDGLVYLQISRGAARRDHGFPSPAVTPGLVVTAKSLDPRLGEANAERGVAVITLPDERWAHPHVKSLQLLPNVLAKQAAREAGAFEAWLVDDRGFITEGSSTNAWIVAADGALATRQADQSILRGVTRMTLIDVLAAKGLRLEERPFTREEAWGAREAFLSSATTIAMPVVALDGRPIGDGRPGPVTTALRRDFPAAAARS
jgi:D-alanine transaminase